MPDDTSWNTRLAVQYTKDGQTHTISPIQSFNPTFATAAEAIHSIERTHVGVSYSPKAITFDMSVSATGPAAAQLTALALNGQRFDISLLEFTGTDWSFNSIVLHDCVLTSAKPTNAVVTGTPLATFSGFSMHVATQGADGTSAEAPASK